VLSGFVSFLGGYPVLYFLASLVIVYAVAATFVRRFDGI
jgi:hypothetical protein